MFWKVLRIVEVILWWRIEIIYFSLNAYVILSVTLCVSDALMLLLTGIPTTVSMFQLRKPIPEPFCTVSGWFLNFNLRFCSFITTCICSLRCYAVLYPLHLPVIPKRCLSLMVLFCSFLAFLSASLPFFFSNLSYYHYNRLVGFCFYVLPFSYSENPLNWSLTLLVIEGVFFVPFFISIVTCCMMIPVLCNKRSIGPMNGVEERNYRAIWSICRITLFTVACFAPQLIWAVIDKVCEFYSARCGKHDNCW